MCVTNTLTCRNTRSSLVYLLWKSLYICFLWNMIKEGNSHPRRVLHLMQDIALRISNIPEFQLDHCYASPCRIFQCLSQNDSEIWGWSPYTCKRPIDSGSGLPDIFYKLTSNADHMPNFGFVVVSALRSKCLIYPVWFFKTLIIF